MLTKSELTALYNQMFCYNCGPHVADSFLALLESNKAVTCKTLNEHGFSRWDDIIACALVDINGKVQTATSGEMLDAMVSDAILADLKGASVIEYGTPVTPNPEYIERTSFLLKRHRTHLVNQAEKRGKPQNHLWYAIVVHIQVQDAP